MAPNALVSYVVLGVFAVFLAILLCSEPVGGLTAFGKSPSGSDKNDKNASKPTRKTNKSCTKDKDCNIAQAMCKLDQIEGRKHCICPDDSPINNGACAQNGVVPGGICNDKNKCIKNAECLPNGTCACYEGYEVQKHNNFHYCSGFERLIPMASSILYSIMAFGIVRIILQFH